MKEDEWIAFCKENDATDTELLIDGEGVRWLLCNVAGRKKRYKLEV